MKIKLLWHQKEDFDKLKKILSKQKAAYLANPTGMGKTVVACAVAEFLQNDKKFLSEKTKNIIVVCPAKLKLQWQDRVEHYLGTSNERDFRFFIFSYNDLSQNGKRDWVRSNQFDLLIIDEAHYAKSLESKRTIFLYSGKSGIINNAQKILAMSATPFKNRVGEIYPFLFATKNKLVENLSHVDFIKRYAGQYREFSLRRGGYAKKIINHKGVSPIFLDELKKNVNQFLIKRPKSDMGGQSSTRVDIPIELSEKFVKQEKKLISELLKIAGHSDTNVELLLNDYSLLHELISLVPNMTEFVMFRKQIGLLKIPSIIEYLTEIAIPEKNKFMLLTYFRDTAKKYYDIFNNQKNKKLLAENGINNIVYVDGGIDVKKRTDLIKKSNQLDDCLFIATMPSIAEGFDFLGFDAQFITELDWSIDLHTQVEGRIDRIGSTMPAYYAYFRLNKGIEKTVYSAIVEKTKTIEKLMS